MNLFVYHRFLVLKIKAIKMSNLLTKWFNPLFRHVLLSLLYERLFESVFSHDI